MKNFIEEKRNIIGMNQRQLASSMNVHYQALQRWERGTVEPTVSTAIRLARALNTTVEELFIVEDEA